MLELLIPTTMYNCMRSCFWCDRRYASSFGSLALCRPCKGEPRLALCRQCKGVRCLLVFSLGSTLISASMTLHAATQRWWSRPIPSTRSDQNRPKIHRMDVHLTVRRRTRNPSAMPASYLRRQQGWIRLKCCLAVWIPPSSGQSSLYLIIYLPFNSFRRIQ